MYFLALNIFTRFTSFVIIFTIAVLNFFSKMGYQVMIRISLGEWKPKLRSDIQEIYDENLDMFRRVYFDADNEDRRYYVYEWYTLGEEKVFYVGKGTGNRYRHILTDQSREKGELYKILQDEFGIAHRIILNDLTDLEAQIYEYYLIKKRNQEGEALIQFVDNDNGFWRGYDDALEIAKKRNERPKVYVRPFYLRYFSISSFYYDTPIIDKVLFSYISYGYHSLEETLRDVERLKGYITANGGYVYASQSKKTKAVIECQVTTYEQYQRYKQKGYEVYHLFDVFSLIESFNTSALKS